MILHFLTASFVLGQALYHLVLKHRTEEISEGAWSWAALIPFSQSLRAAAYPRAHIQTSKVGSQSGNALLAISARVALRAILAERSFFGQVRLAVKLYRASVTL